MQVLATVPNIIILTPTVERPLSSFIKPAGTVCRHQCNKIKTDFVFWVTNQVHIRKVDVDLIQFANMYIVLKDQSFSST